MANEFLQETFGNEALTFEQFNEKLNNAELINNADGSYVLKSDFDNINAELTDLKSDNEKYKDYEPDWKEQLEQAKADGAKALSDYKFEVEMSKALAIAKVADETSVKANLDLNKIKVDDNGKITGLTEQLEALKESKPFLFLADETPKLNLGGSTKGVGSTKVKGIEGAVADFYSYK